MPMRVRICVCHASVSVCACVNNFCSVLATSRNNRLTVIDRYIESNMQVLDDYASRYVCLLQLSRRKLTNFCSQPFLPLPRYKNKMGPRAVLRFTKGVSTVLRPCVSILARRLTEEKKRSKDLPYCIPPCASQ